MFTDVPSGRKIFLLDDLIIRSPDLDVFDFVHCVRTYCRSVIIPTADDDAGYFPAAVNQSQKGNRSAPHTAVARPAGTAGPKSTGTYLPTYSYYSTSTVLLLD